MTLPQYSARSYVRVLLLALLVYGIAWCSAMTCNVELDGKVHAQSLTTPRPTPQRGYSYRVRRRVVDQYERPVAARIVVDASPLTQQLSLENGHGINTTVSQVQEPLPPNKALSRLNLPNRLRHRLVERFDLFIKYEQSQSYDKQFDLLAKRHIARLLKINPTKENYVRFKQATEIAVGKLVGLRVNRIRRTSNDFTSLSFSVMAKLKKGPSTYFDAPIFVAYLENGNWYFSLLYID